MKEVIIEELHILILFLFVISVYSYLAYSYYQLERYIMSNGYTLTVGIILGMLIQYISERIEEKQSL